MEEISRASQEHLQATARLATVGEMASLLSHELTQPLVAISSYATGSLNMLGSDDGAAGSAGNEAHLRQQLQDLRMAMERISFQADRSEEHTSELQSPCNLVCRLLLEKKK